MLEFHIDVVGPADLLLYEGLPVLQPALRRLDEGALLIGGLAVAAWMSARPARFEARATRDIDLGINRAHLGIKRDQAIVGPLLRGLEFRSGYNDEDFRFARETTAGTFIVDCLVAKGASREEPPVVEAGMPSLAAPGLAYAFRQGAVPLRIVLHGEQEREIAMHTVTLDAAFVMKAAFTASGLRIRADRRTTDTVDAVLLAAALGTDPQAVAALAANRRHREAKAAIRWISESFDSPRSATSRRFADHFQDDEAADWAVETIKTLRTALEHV